MKRPSTRAPRRSSPSSLLEPPVRPHFFAGRLLTAADLQREQEYHIRKQRRLNLAVLGAGVVSGLRVAPAGRGGVRVSPGWAVDPHGREIIVPCETLVPWPAAPRARRASRWYVALSYAEEEIEPVPVPDAQFANLAIRETFRVTLHATRPLSTDVLVVLGSVRAP